MNKIVRFLTTTFLLLMLVGISAFAQTSTWDGTAVSWTQGSGTEDDPYLIASAQNLAYLAEMVNGGVNQYSGKWFKLTTDIDLNNLEWTPIGNYNTTDAIFCGNFDGDNHNIIQLNINSGTHVGLFGYVSITSEADRLFKNINVSGEIRTRYTSQSQYCGGIVGYASAGNFENCNSYVSFTNSYDRCGGIIGYVSSDYDITITNCSNTGSVLAPHSNSCSGGIIGGVSGNGTITITNCSNTGSVSAAFTSSSSSTSYSGGIIGNVSSDGTVIITNCSNTGSVSANGRQGGIIGNVPSDCTIVITNCINTGSVSASGSSFVYSGGIIGNAGRYCTITSCSNTGSVSAASGSSYAYSGGIIGYKSYNNITITNCSNTGNVTADLTSSYSGHCYSGGIIGCMKSGTITLCVNTGIVSSTSTTSGEGTSSSSSDTYSYSGGIAGYSDASSSSYQTSISLCYNTGTISASASNSSSSSYAPVYSYPGGILGMAYNASYSIIDNSYNRGNITATASKPSSYYAKAYEYASGIGNTCTTTNCYNTGTLTAPTTACSNAYKRGIGNSTTTTNCYYLETCGGNGSGTSKTEAAMKSESFPLMLNSEVFIMDVTPNVNDGYPIFGERLYIVTALATNLDFTSATLNGLYYAGSSYPNPADMQGFEWKAASASEWNTVYTNVGTPASYNLTGLTSGVTYNYRIFLRFGDQVIYGNTVDFTTRACDAAVSVTTENATICDNTTTALTANATSSGSISSYSWSTGDEGTGITANAAGSYTVTVTDEFNCTAEGSITIATIAAPTAAISGNAYLCTGSSTTLTAQGGVGYVWSTGATTPMINVSEPNEYYVVARASNGCTDTAYITVVNFNEVAISGNTIICAGESTTLSVSECTSYQWSTDETTQSIEVSAEGTYSVTVTNAQCEASTSVYVTVNQLPTPAITGVLALCGDASTTLSVNGGVSFVWSDGTTDASITVSEAGTYTVIATSGTGCTASTSATVSISENPTVTIGGNPSVCGSGSTTLTAQGGNTYLWSTGFAGASINVSEAGTYSVVATNAAGCTASDSLSVAQYDVPVASINGNTTFCEGSSTTITADGGVSYLWSTGETSASINVDAFGVYSVTATNNGGCTATANVTVFVASAPSATISGNLHICDNEPTTLTANGGDSYMWSNASTGNSIDVSNAGTYSVIATNENGCSAIVSVEVTTGSTITNTISETAATEFTWNGQTYSESGDYPQSFIASNGCDSIVTLHLTITGSTEPQQYNIFVMSNNNAYGTTTGTGVYEENEVVTISASAYSGYEFVSWSDGNTGNPRQITVTGNATYVANFAETGSVAQVSYTITVLSSDASAGMVSGSGTYLANTQAVISAEANAGYMFVSWNDGVADNPRIITVTEDATYTAMFMQSGSIETYTINALSGNPNYGTVYGGGTYVVNTFVNLYAIAYEGYEFVSWSDGNTDNPRRITVTGNAMYIATFVPATGIEETSAFEIALFPNPATDILNISFSETISEIEIVNVMGQVVKRMEVNADNVVCDVEELKAGVYVVRIHTEGTVVSQRKFVKE